MRDAFTDAYVGFDSPMKLTEIVANNPAIAQATGFKLK